MIKKRLFVNQDTPSIIDTEYQRCNFGHTDPFWDGSKWIGNRLFPGDNTSRTFIQCNLINCEPPPGSTILRCNCAIIRPEVLQGSSPDIVIDGEPIMIDHFKRIVYGKWTPQGYLYYPTPKEYPFDREVV